MTAAAYAAVTLILAGCCAYALSVQAGHERAACLPRTATTWAARTLLQAALPAAWAIGRVRAGALRARWAWRCRGTPVPADGEKLTREETQALGNIDAGRDVRSRT